MPHLTKSWQIIHGDFNKAGEVSLQIQALLKEIGFDSGLIRRASVCAYESEMNVVMHGGDGNINLILTPDLITIEIADNGPGIDDIELAMQEGFSTATPEHREMGFGAGMGIPNIKKNADLFEIVSEKTQGTCLTISFRVDDTHVEPK